VRQSKPPIGAVKQQAGFDVALILPLAERKGLDDRAAHRVSTFDCPSVTACRESAARRVGEMRRSILGRAGYVLPD
ncbi:MAG: hypothetical protein AAGI34_15925, partial [Pseudomonadota bacterium]